MVQQLELASLSQLQVCRHPPLLSLVGLTNKNVSGTKSRMTPPTLKNAYRMKIIHSVQLS